MFTIRELLIQFYKGEDLPVKEAQKAALAQEEPPALGTISVSVLSYQGAVPLPCRPVRTRATFLQKYC